MLAMPGLVPARIAIVDEGVQVAVADGEDAAAAAAVTAVGSPEGDELLAAEAHAAVAAIAGDDVDRGFVDEFHDGVSVPAERSPGL